MLDGEQISLLDEIKWKAKKIHLIKIINILFIF